MNKPLFIQTGILSLIIIIIFFSYRFFLYEGEKKEESLLNKIDEDIIKNP